jgi:hypothetical protein
MIPLRDKNPSYTFFFVNYLPIFFFFDIIDISTFLFIGFWFLLQFVSGLQTVGIDTSPGIAWWVHIGGFIAGILMVPVFKKKRFAT